MALDTPSATGKNKSSIQQSHERYVREVVDTLNTLDAAQAIVNLLTTSEGELPVDCPRPALEAAAKTAVTGRGAAVLRERACDLIEEITVSEIAAQNAVVASSWFGTVEVSVGAIASWLLLPFDQDGSFHSDGVWITLHRKGPSTRIIYSLTHDGSLVVRSWLNGVGIEAKARSLCLTAYLDELLEDIGLEE